MDVISQIGGEIWTLVVRRDYAYTGGPCGFSILDVSNAQRPAQVSSLPIPVMDLQVLDTYVYIAGQENGLHVVDVSDPAAPFVSTSYTSIRAPQKLVLTGDISDKRHLAYVLSYEEGLHIIDISNPQALTRVGTLNERGVFYYDLAVSHTASGQSFAFVATSRGTQIVDVSDPAQPKVVKVLKEPRGNLTILGTCLYISWDDELGDEWTHVVDVSDPTAPEIVGKFQPAFTNAALGNSRYLYVTRLGSNVGVLDVSDPAKPELVASSAPDFDFYAFMGEPRTIAAAGNYIYVINEIGLHILDVQNPESPIPVGFYDTLHSATDLAVSGDVVYVAQGAAYNSWDIRGALSVVDISDPAAPVPTERHELSYPASNTIVANGYLYVNRGHCFSWAGYCIGGLSVFDISDAPSPRQVASYDIPSTVPLPPDFIGSGDWYFSDVNITGEWTFLTGFPIELGVTYTGGGLQVLHMPGWITPTETAVLTTGVGGEPWKPLALDVMNDGQNWYAYLVDDDTDLHVIDLADRLHPVQVGNYPAPKTRDVVVADNRLYLLGHDELSILDLSDPASPRKLSSYSPLDGAQQVAINGSLAYILSTGKGLSILDVSDPLHPVKVGFYYTMGFASDIAVAGGYIYVADYEGGLVVLRFHPYAESRMQ